MACCFTDANALPALRVSASPTGRHRCSPGISLALGLLAGGNGPVRLRMAGASQSGPGLADGHQDLDSRLRRRYGGRRRGVRVHVVRASRPVRGVQRGGVAAVAVSAQRCDWPSRRGQSARPSAHHAGASGHPGGVGGAAGLHRVRQLLRVTGLQEVRRPQRGIPSAHRRRDRRHAASIRGAVAVRCRCRDDVLGRRAGDRRRDARKAARAARAAGAQSHPHRGGLRVRALPLVSGGARSGDYRPVGGPARPRMASARARFRRRGVLPVAASDVAVDHQGRVRRPRTHPRGRRRARSGAARPTDRALN